MAQKKIVPLAFIVLVSSDTPPTKRKRSGKEARGEKKEREIVEDLRVKKEKR
jgi:hypothetical protein